jgi:hypothetical protein
VGADTHINVSKLQWCCGSLLYNLSVIDELNIPKKESERDIAVTYRVFLKLIERGRLMCISFPFAQNILINVVYDRYAQMYLV